MNIKLPAIITFSILVAACSPSKQEEKNQTSHVKPVTEEAGVIIGAQPEPDTLKGSLKAYATASLSGADVRVNYYSPAVRGRVIWGGLVPYDNVWVTGAHRATHIEFNKDLKFGEKIIPAGKYALFTIPGKDSWNVIINKNWNQHLADNYTTVDDIVRIKVTPAITNELQERLRYTFTEPGAGSGNLVIQWEQIEITVPFEVLN